MANPNKSLARTSKVLTVVDEKNFGADKLAAILFRDGLVAEGKNARMFSYAIGPKKAPTFQYYVRVYERV